MIRNFFKTALRNILKDKTYTLINFIGLTCGISLVLLITSYVRSETSFDRFHEKSDRLYRLSYLVPNGLKLAVTPPPIAPLMKDFFPAVEEAARIYSRNVSVSHREGSDNETFEESQVMFADSMIMKMFSFEFVSGSPKNALQERFTVLLTEEMAKKYFGNKNPVGESLVFNGKDPYKVIGVVKDFPENSHLRFHMLVPYDNMYDLEGTAGSEILRRNLATNFVVSHSFTYVLLKPGADPSTVDKSMSDFLKKNCPPNRSIGQIFTLMPLKDIHLKSDLLGEPTSTNSITNLLIFSGIGILALLIACINYINLTTAQSFTRTKEIGIRKILGSARSQLIIQFLCESLLFCSVALLLSYFIFYLTLPVLNAVTSKNLIFQDVVDFPLLIGSVLLLVIISLMAGGYPAYFVAQFDSISSIKGSSSTISGGQFLRKSLVVFQLTIAFMLLSGTLMLIKQLNFLNDRPLGFQKDNILTIPLMSQNNINAVFTGADSTFQTRLQSFRDRIETYPDVVQTTASNATPGLGTVYRGVVPEGFTQEDNLFIPDLSIDYDFVKVYDMKIKTGRTFSKDFGTDEPEGFIINEAAVKEFRFGTLEKAIGKTINREGKKGKVIGVINDFNITSLTAPISGLLVEISRRQWSNLSVKIKSTNVRATIDKLRNEWNNLFPEKAFEFSFLDEQLNQQYANFENFGKIIQSFTLIAIIISCLGVYGLVLFVVQRKVKEIGVRKVLGASIGGVLKLIYRDFAWLILIGFILATPFSYYFILKWLQNFSYHTEIDFITYALSFFILLTVVTLTISYQAIKASLANPVKSLRTE